MRTFSALSTWMLGGALVASLTWNWTLAREPEAPAVSCATSCSSETLDLDLDAEQRAALDAVCARSCGESDALERHADELQRALLASLSAETVDAAAAAKLVDEVSALRKRSLQSCVAGILGVREVLSGEDVRALLERCEHTSCR